MTPRGSDVELVNPELLDPYLGEAALIDMSWSRMDSYDWCPRKYKFKYCDGLADGWALPLAVGKAVHETLEACVKYNVKDKTEAIGFFLDAIDKNDRDGQMTDVEVQEARDMVTTTFDVLTTTADFSNVIDVEWGFGYVLGRGLFIGYLDLIFWDEDEDGMFIHIRDYKTGKTKKKTKQSGQMKLYTLAVKAMYPGYRVKAGLYWVRDDTEDVYEFSDEELEEFKTTTARIIDIIIDDESYRPTPQMFKCGYCSFAREDICKFGFMQSQKLNKYRTKQATKKDK